MVRLKNIRKNNSFITCDAYFEGCKEPVKLHYSVEEKSFLPFHFPKGYEYCKSHARFARDYFESLGDEDPPSSMTIMWY